ncbi:hypothetical protein JXL19_00745 [bacterium]|nr:hypothetical protein [bacterium]
MKRVYCVFILLSVYVIFGAGNHPVFAHGVHYKVDKAEAMIIKVEYDGGEPMGYAEVKIFSPDDQKVEYQNGRTDREGRFSFLPEKGGAWKVVVSDGMGHGVTAEVSADHRPDAGKMVQSAGFNTWQKVIIALSVIWGLIGFAFFFQARIIKRQ